MPKDFSSKFKSVLKDFYNYYIKYGPLVRLFRDIRSFNEFQMLINESDGNVSFDFDVVFTQDDSVICISSDDLVIDGNGHTVDALAKSSILEVNSNNVTLKNINFMNSNSKQSCLHVAKESSLNLFNCKFKNNCSENGGAINNEGEIKLEGCSFEKNSALGRAGAIENHRNSKVYLTGCNFSKNSAENGGALSNMGRCGLSVRDCNFENNNALDTGGVIYNWLGLSDVEGSNFINNESESAGAIDNYLGNIRLKESRFKDNTVKKDAGAIFNGGSTASFDCLFENNSALKGGAIYAAKSSSGNISDSRFNSNQAQGDGGLGGAIFNNSVFSESHESCLNLINCNFSNNSANDDGAAIFNRGCINLDNCSFDDNLTVEDGKTFQNEGNNVKVSVKVTNVDV